MSTTVNKKKIVKFAPRGNDSFYDAMKREVEAYFQTNKIDQHANSLMKLKTAMMLSLYFIPYVLIVTGVASVSLWLFYPLWLIMGVGIVGIGTCIMHDSNHGAYSSKKSINNVLGSTLNFIGGYDRNWRIQHNILHHTYTNIDGLDEDIAGTILIRMSPQKPKLGIHRFQHIYAWVLYALMNLMWVVLKDFKLIFRYNKEGLLTKEKITLRKALIELIAIKSFYIANIVVIPILFSGMSVGQVLLGFLMMHVVAGLSLAMIFQPAHVMETSSFQAPDSNMKMEDDWAKHQLLNTTNYAPGSKLTAWFIGGLNYQIEHHLFPHVCHIHYPEISKIVKNVAIRYELPYNEQPTFARAIAEHGRMLKILGKTS